jgi:hypothetical protein
MKRVLFRPQAVRDLERLPNDDRDQVEDAIERFVQTGSGDVKMLTGEGRQLRLRGDNSDPGLAAPQAGLAGGSACPTTMAVVCYSVLQKVCQQ